MAGQSPDISPHVVFFQFVSTWPPDQAVESVYSHCYGIRATKSRAQVVLRSTVFLAFVFQYL
jgi:hypothetical protein